MKKIICFFVASLLLLFSMTIFINAVDETAPDCETSKEIIYLDDGRYLEISITVTEKYDVLRSTTSSSEIYTGDKTIVCKDENGNVEWEYILSAEFNVVEGVSSTCTNVSYTQNIYKSVWSFSDGGTSKSGNTAYGYGTFKRKALFITLEEQIIDLAFTCDLYGNLS